MFNFKDQQIKITQSQTSNSVKNLRKELPKQSPFRYGSKKISFNVKNRSEYWDDIEKVYVNEQARIDSIIGNVLQNLMNGKDTDYDIADSVMYSPVSPVLATTLVMLNKALFQCKTFSDYMDSDEAQVYAYTHWNGKNFVTNPTALVIDNPFGNETEKYMKILPGYSKISVMNFYKGYQVYVTDYSSTSPVSSSTAAVSKDPIFWGSYHIDTKRFQRVFATKPDLDRVESGSIVSNVTFKDSEGMDVETLNMHPELDSYLYADGIFKKLMDSPYNSQSYQISVLRGGYGFGPINIACFLKAKEFDIERITDIISGLLIAEDSGMPLIDAIRGIQEWRISVHDTDIDTIFDSLSDIRILRYIEYIGSIFFTAILGSSLKEKPLINIPLTSVERKIYDVGYLMGHNYDIFVQMFKNGIKNKIWLKDSTEIFSFEVPCVLYGTEPTTGIFKIGDYVKNYSDSLLLGSEPLDYAFNVSSILEKEKALTGYILPQKGYTIFDFVTKGLNKCLITEIIKNVNYYDTSSKYSLNNIDNSAVGCYSGELWELIYFNISSDFLIAPRLELKDNNYNRTMNELTLAIDKNKCRVRFENWGSTNKLIAQYPESKYQDQSLPYIIFNGNFQLFEIIGNNEISGSCVTNFVISCDISADSKISIYMGFNKEDYRFYNNYKLYEVINPIIKDFDSYVAELHNGNQQLYNKDTKQNVLKYILDNFDSKNITSLDITLKDVRTNQLKQFKLKSWGEALLFYRDHNSVGYALHSNVFNLNKKMSDTVNNKNSDLYDTKTIPTMIYEYGEVFSRKSDTIIAALVNNCVRDLIYECSGYQFDNFTKNSYNYSGVSTNSIETVKLQVENNINSLSLCFLKLSVINAFCMSYSIDLLSLPDSVRSFYDIYKSYLGDFIEIKQEIQN